MNDNRAKINLIKYGGCALFVALCAYLYISSRDFMALELVDKYLVLCDAFTVSGTVLLIVGCLFWTSSKGALDGLGYSFQLLFRSLIPGRRLARDEKYGDYLERKRNNRAKGYGFLFYSGLVTMAIALVFMGLFYSLYS